VKCLKKHIIWVAAWVFVAILVYTIPGHALDVSARSAVVLDGDSGEILWAKNAQEQSLIASTTKIMTALVVLENAELTEAVTVPAEAVGVEGSSMYLREGEILTVQDLLYGMMLSSGNDAAVALALHVGGTVEDFVAMMNQKAEELELKDTHFANPNGLDQEGNYATAESLGKLSAAAMQNTDFLQIVSSKSYCCDGHDLTNHNKLLWQYPGAVGVKTGFTKRAGRILVGSAQKDGRRLISVTIYAPDDWEDHKKLLDFGFSQYQEQVLVTAGEIVGSIPLISGQKDAVSLVATDTIKYFMLPNETPEFRLLTPNFLYAAVEAGTQCGTLQVYVAGKLAAATPVYTAETVSQIEPEPGFWEKIFDHQNGGT
jgi:D-alanyl-D-alanine carboxypeptidase